MNILGISGFYHDSAACLIRDGKIIAAAQEERFTRKKHDPSFPAQAAAYCLKEGGISADDLDMVGFYDKPLLTFERLLTTYMAFAPKGFESFRAAIPVWMKEKLWMRATIQDSLEGYQGKIYFTQHHQSHAASAFYPSPFQDAAVLTMDGVGEWATSSIAKGEGNKISVLKELRFPHSLGMLYSAFTYQTGFKVNSGEYKVMGLAPYGEPKYAQTIYDNLLDLKEDGSFKLNMDYFNFATGLTMTNDRFSQLFGGRPRKPGTEITQREMDLAASVQAVCEEIMLRMARHARKIADSPRLCLAGGVALNSVGNGKILREGFFDDIWIQPAAGDAGGALGSALALWHQYLGKTRTPEADFQRGSLLGPQYSKDEIEAFLKGRGIAYEALRPETRAERVAGLISRGNIVGWFHGRMEYGPRALGARSILADPRDPAMQSKMNLTIKFRESFRPFAPAILSEKAADYFDIPSESPYMLLVAPVTEKRRKKFAREAELPGFGRLKTVRSDIPAVTHVDYSARIQTVGPKADGPLRELLIAFEEKTGCPLLVNTSFNVRGEPIVCRPEEAYTCFIRTGMDYLVLGDFLLSKKDQPAGHNDTAWKKEFSLD